MPLPVHRLNLRLLPQKGTVEETMEVLREAGFLDGDRPGARVLVPGGWQGLVLRREAREIFLSSGMGGFRVFCPLTGQLVVGEFSAALGRWRQGGERSLSCACGGRHDLGELRFEPAAGFAREWIELRGVQSPEWTEEAEKRLTGVRLLPHRG